MLGRLLTVSSFSKYRVPDWLGSFRIESTSSRTSGWSGAFAPFGERYFESGSPAAKTFAGHNWDTVGDLYDALYRENSGAQGRWISPDPAGLATVNPANPQSWNRYAYVLNNPIGLVDPLGLGEFPSETIDQGFKLADSAPWLDITFVPTIRIIGWHRQATRILAKHSDIVGWYAQPGSPGAAFKLTGGQFTSFSYPGAFAAVAWGINNSGEIVGWWKDSSITQKIRSFSFNNMFD